MGTPVKFIVLRGLFFSSQHNFKLSKEIQKTMANFSKRMLSPQKSKHSHGAPGACIFIPSRKTET